MMLEGQARMHVEEQQHEARGLERCGSLAGANEDLPVPKERELQMAKLMAPPLLLAAAEPKADKTPHRPSPRADRQEDKTSGQRYRIVQLYEKEMANIVQCGMF